MCGRGGTGRSVISAIDQHGTRRESAIADNMLVIRWYSCTGDVVLRSATHRTAHGSKLLHPLVRSQHYRNPAIMWDQNQLLIDAFSMKEPAKASQQEIQDGQSKAKP